MIVVDGDWPTHFTQLFSQYNSFSNEAQLHYLMQISQFCLFSSGYSYSSFMIYTFSSFFMHSFFVMFSFLRRTSLKSMARG